VLRCFSHWPGLKSELLAIACFRGKLRSAFSLYDPHGQPVGFYAMKNTICSKEAFFLAICISKFGPGSGLRNCFQQAASSGSTLLCTWLQIRRLVICFTGALNCLLRVILLPAQLFLPWRCCRMINHCYPGSLPSVRMGRQLTNR
jgi:hypothetical protein